MCGHDYRAYKRRLCVAEPTGLRRAPTEISPKYRRVTTRLQCPDTNGVKLDTEVGDKMMTKGWGPLRGWIGQTSYQSLCTDGGEIEQTVP